MIRAIKRQVLTNVNPSPNITFLGLGGIGLTRSQLLEGCHGISSANIKSWHDDGVDLHVHINKRFRLDKFATTRVNMKTPTSEFINEHSEGIIDSTGLIVSITGSSYYSQTSIKPRKFIFNGLTHIRGEGFRDVRGCYHFEAPNLSLVENAGLSSTSQGSPTAVEVDFPNLTNYASFGNTNFKFYRVQSWNTGEVNLTFNTRNTFFPFPNATSMGAQCFRNNARLEGDIILNNITGNLGNINYNWNNASKVERIIIPNATSIGQSNNTFHNTNALEELDIRSVTSIDIPDNNIWGTLDRSKLVIHANEALRYVNGGQPHQFFTEAISRGATMIWHV